MPVTGNNWKEVPGWWFQNPMYRSPNRYNRAVRMHKLVYEALMRQARSGFSTWVT